MTDWQLSVPPPLTTAPFHPLCSSNASASFASFTLSPRQLPRFLSFSIFFPPFLPLCRHPLILLSSLFFSFLFFSSLFFFFSFDLPPSTSPRPTGKPIIRHRLIRSVSKQAHPGSSLFVQRRGQILRPNLKKFGILQHGCVFEFANLTKIFSRIDRDSLRGNRRSTGANEVLYRFVSFARKEVRFEEVINVVTSNGS